MLLNIPPHGGTISIEIILPLNEIVISVTDEGIGISQEDINQIFEPFRRTAKTRETIAGVGLGLSVAKRIIEAHGGRIEVKSSVNIGSTFFIFLPKKDQRGLN